MEEKITEALKKGPRTNQELRGDLGIKTYDAKLDRILQKMRKESKIKVVKGRWMGTTTEVCKACGGCGWVKK